MRGSRTALRLGAAFTLTAAVVTFVMLSGSGPAGDRIAFAVLHGLLVAVPMTIGIAALHGSAEDRFARSLVIAGALWSTLALTESTDPLLYSIGRVSMWVAEAGVVYLLVTFPRGRAISAAADTLMRAALGVLGVLYLPTALLVQQFPSPVPSVSCGTSCPDNALALTSTTPAFVTDLVIPLRQLLTVALLAAVTVMVLSAARRAAPAMRRALVPAAVAAILHTLALGLYFAGRSSGDISPTTDALGWVFAVSPLLLPIGFGIGLLSRRIYATVALQREVVRLGAHAGPSELREALAVALGDPSVEIVHWHAGDPGLWVDASGWPTARPQRSAERDVTEIIGAGGRLGAIVHDATLAHDPTVMQAAASYAVMALENSALVIRLQNSLDDLAAAQARMTAAADDARRRIERDLHDGAQQRLVALRIKLSMEAERIEAQDEQAAARLVILGEEVQATIDEVRDLAHGIYPSLLAERGLCDALSAAAIASPIPTRVAAKGIGRYTPEVEAAVYFACVEAMQNAAKHATGAQQLTVTLSDREGLQFSVTDDGPGLGDDAENALTSLRDRLRTVGGEVTVQSQADHGTSILGVVPCVS